MRGFVEGDDFTEMFLSIGGKSRAALSFAGQERIGRDIEKAGPALAESAGNLRDAESAKGERAIVGLVETNAGIYVPAELFKCCGGIGRNLRYLAIYFKRSATAGAVF